MKLLPKMLKLAVLVASLGLGLAALCFWMTEGLDRPAHANPVPPQADVEVISHSCWLPAGVINVSDDVPLRCTVSVHNDGPYEPPVDAEVTVDVVSSPGCTVMPSSVTVPVVLPVSQKVDVFPAWMTVHCAQPGSHQLEHTSTVSLIEPGVVDPDPTNNSLGPTPLPFEAVIPGVTSVEIDIKPGSDPNSVNLNSRGVISVAILTTEYFDATTVDPDTVRFGPAEAEKAHDRAHIEDVDGDGDLDLMFHFRTQDTGIAPGDTEACLTGQTYDGVPIMGCDSVRTLPMVEPLKIGLLAPYTGALSDFGIAFERSASLAVKEINEAGGVFGRDVILVTADSATDPLKAQEEARRLIDIEKVSAIIGAAASGVTLPVAESVTVPAEILQISPSSTSPAISVVEDKDYLFRTAVSDVAQGAVLAHLASDLSFTSACTMYIDNAYGQGLSEAFAQSFEYLGGTVTAQVPHATDPQDSYLDELNQCVAGSPDVLAAISYPEHASVYLREALDVGLTDMFLFVDGTKSPEMFEELGWDNFEGMYGTAPGALETAAGAAFADAYEAEYGERPPLPFMAQTYDAVYVIALAAAKANATDSTAIRDALRDIANPPGELVGPGVAGFEGALGLIAASTDIDYSGASGPIDFDENGDVPHGAIEVWQITAGEIVEAVRTFEVDLSTTPPTVTEVTE